MKKLFALMMVGGLLALTAGCPSSPTSEPVKPVNPASSSSPSTAGATENKVTGKVTKMDNGKLTIKGDDGKENTYTVPADAKITVDGKDGTAADVKADSTVTVTEKGGTASKVEVKK